MVLRAAVVPEGPRPGRPAHAAGEARCGLDVPEQQVEEGAALLRFQAPDVAREAGVHVEQFPPRFRMADHHRMLAARVLLSLRRLDPVGADVGQGAVVDPRQPFEEALHGLGEELEGEVHVREERVAATDLRRLRDVERRAEGRDRIAGHVRVPAVAGRVAGVRVGLHRQGSAEPFARPLRAVAAPAARRVAQARLAALASGAMQRMGPPMPALRGVLSAPAHALRPLDVCPTRLPDRAFTHTPTERQRAREWVSASLGSPDPRSVPG